MNQQTGKNYFIVMAELSSCDDFCSLWDCFLYKNSQNRDIEESKLEQNSKQNLW